MLEVSPDRARRLVLDVQGLRTQRPCKSLLDVAARIHNIQIDTISVVSRSHNLISLNRYSEYQEGDVWKLEKEGKLFEYWSHSMCLMPIESFPYYVWKMERMRESKTDWYVRWGVENKEIVDSVFKHVEKDGATKSRDLGEGNSSSDGWWDWKKEKRALEYLMNVGRLMVAYREGFQKFYDLPERVVPPGIATDPMEEEELPRYLIDIVFRSLGVADYRDVKSYTGGMVAKHLWRNQRNAIEGFIDSLVGDFLEEINFGHRNRYFIHKDYVSDLEESSFADSCDPVKILTPFDNILRERHYPQSIWNFDYKIECYMPKPDRKYGYFVLPLLDQTELRGRADLKVHRKEGLLEIVSLYLEDSEIQSDEGLERLARGIRDFAGFHSCRSIKIGKIIPKRISKRAQASLEFLKD